MFDSVIRQQFRTNCPNADEGSDTMFFTWLDQTPVGRLFLAGDSDALRYLLFDGGSMTERHDVRLQEWEQNAEKLKEPVTQLNAYFSGRLQQFDFPVAGQGTDFQQRVWSALRDIPYGATASYGDIAKVIGQPTASRAVGMANGRNPISIIVPCHRVIGTSGKLVGYGGGLERKKSLLRLEGVAV
ncbi:MAG: methylated-DNA--[protein]-cysteine S-methyltransferase [Fuerstiella sp.]|nr:methylated-DNA--[protein]-cysteine S-methyltransferase [Fuerstiella sp.]